MRNLKWPQVVLILGFLGGGILMLVFAKNDAMTAGGGGLLGTVTGWVGRAFLGDKKE